ncbi:hypothetical protein C5167_033640 [Papaver somniferum]|uniref:t-SNARE coiled-coil homology domain-containing protein n=1 Tax=Papaver somniferum TaxID=3469 RepID=A0A4Y7KEA2_PAPSO|nr:hypothetical protein C5167_033640 [Papaver somniferum]
MTGDSDQILQKAIQQHGRGQVMDTLTEIQERHGVVRDVESKILELHQIFMDMAVLVESQGDMLDNIESQEYIDDPEDKKPEVEQLRKRFIHSIAPRGLAGDRRYVVPASGFSLTAQQIC